MVNVSSGKKVSSGVSITAYPVNFSNGIIVPSKAPPVQFNLKPIEAKKSPYVQKINYDNLIFKKKDTSNIAGPVNTTNSSNKSTMPLQQLVIGTGGYYLTNLAVYGKAEANDLKDVALFAASDFLAIYGFKEWIKTWVSKIIGVDQSTVNEQLIVDFISDMLAIMSPYMLINMFMDGDKKKVSYLAVGTTGSYIVNKGYEMVMKQRAGVSF